MEWIYFAAPRFHTGLQVAIKLTYMLVANCYWRWYWSYAYSVASVQHHDLLCWNKEINFSAGLTLFFRQLATHIYCVSILTALVMHCISAHAVCQSKPQQKTYSMTRTNLKFATWTDMWTRNKRTVNHEHTCILTNTTPNNKTVTLFQHRDELYKHASSMQLMLLHTKTVMWTQKTDK